MGDPVSTNRETPYDVMWRTMKMLNAFTPRELADAATTAGARIAPHAAVSYCLRLASAGVLVTPICSSRQAAHLIRYRLARNLGAKAPKIVKLEAIFDPNACAFIGLPVIPGASR